MAPAKRAVTRHPAKGRRPAVAEHEPRAADGRVPGRRGRATRERLLRCTADLLEQRSYRDLKVIDIARCAGTSPATFYQYFPDVEAAILVLAGGMAEEAGDLTALVKQSSWRGRAGPDTALRFVDGFLALWTRNRPVLRVVELSTAEGDLRFRNIRTRILNDITVALSEAVAVSRGKAKADAEPMAHAAALVSMLATVASHRYGFEFWGIRMEQMRRSMAQIVATTVTGRS